MPYERMPRLIVLMLPVQSLLSLFLFAARLFGSRAELFRAVRLVVDTGIHAKRWTREEAIDYMLTNTGITETDVVSEIERYIVLPGQATAYKVGMMELMRLRQEAQDALGEQFDIRDFHDVVLQSGALPLTALREEVMKYIARKEAA